MQFADPRTDFIFRKIFGNEQTKEVLISFLNAVLGLEEEHAIATVTILDPYQAPKISSLKRSFLDVKCRDQRGVEFVVEMQVAYTEGFSKRIQYNAYKAYVGQIPSGVDYPQLNQVIAISILDFTMFKEFEHYLSCHELRETITNNCYLDDIRHYLIELPKFTLAETAIETPIEKWCFFLKHAGELQTIPEKLKTEPYLKAFEVANRANMTREEWEVYDATMVAIQDERGRLTGAVKLAVAEARAAARMEGRIEGRMEGEQRGQRKLLEALLQKGFDQSTIANMTGLSQEEVASLLSATNH